MSVVGVCYSNNRILKTGDTVLFQCTVPLIGEHVQIKLQGKGILTLCEVKVYGRPYIVGKFYAVVLKRGYKHLFFFLL